MVRKYQRKTKLKSKPVKSTRTTKGKKIPSQHSSPEHQSVSNTSELDFTFPEGNHLDSFDIIRTDEHK